jgi:Carboxypeptidase regulatory-like domain
MRKTIFCLLAASFALAAADAAARVHTAKVGGTVLERNGKPAVGANVMIERSDGSSPSATRTDSEGRFLFRFVLSGLYDIRASHGASATAWHHNIMVHAGKETVVNLRLEPIASSVAK